MTATTIRSVADLNAASGAVAQTWFVQTCTAQKWCRKMVQQRPFSNVDALTTQASELWHDMTNADFMQAFSGHPMIGDLSTLREKYASTKALASNEQSAVQSASEATLKNLQRMNQEYVVKHGFIFIICATGLSAQAMLTALEIRLPNNTDIEIQKAAQEQLKITLLRINKAFSNTSE
jgi:2-oxo-4-hydroxy-4-carboxy-5-ureidoimidazoline decarboxylase